MADQTLVKTFTDIADAIRAKDGSTGTMKPTEMPGKIAAIETGTDTSDATVTASDLASGVVAYGKDGKVTGNVSVITNFFQNGTAKIIRYLPNTTDISKSQFLVDSQNVPFPVLIRTSSGQRVLINGSDFGDATAADVATGKTFTSTSGLKVTGTGKLESYTYGFETTPASNTQEISFEIVKDADTAPDVSVFYIERYGDTRSCGSSSMPIVSEVVGVYDHNSTNMNIHIIYFKGGYTAYDSLITIGNFVKSSDGKSITGMDFANRGYKITSPDNSLLRWTFTINVATDDNAYFEGGVTYKIKQFTFK